MVDSFPPIAKTETVVREDNSIYMEVDYMDHLRLRLDIVKGNIKEKLFWRNRHGGIDVIDKMACSNYHPFEAESQLLRAIIKEQCKKKLTPQSKE